MKREKINTPQAKRVRAKLDAAGRNLISNTVSKSDFDLKQDSKKRFREQEIENAQLIQAYRDNRLKSVQLKKKAKRLVSIQEAKAKRLAK